MYNANAFPIHVRQLCGRKYVSEVEVTPRHRQEVVAREEEVEKEAGNVDATCRKKMSDKKMVQSTQQQATIIGESRETLFGLVKRSTVIGTIQTTTKPVCDTVKLSGKEQSNFDVDTRDT